MRREYQLLDLPRCLPSCGTSYLIRGGLFAGPPPLVDPDFSLLIIEFTLKSLTRNHWLVQPSWPLPHGTFVADRI
jgi:hypothetical protein